MVIRCVDIVLDCSGGHTRGHANRQHISKHDTYLELIASFDPVPTMQYIINRLTLSEQRYQMVLDRFCATSCAKRDEYICPNICLHD